MYIPFGIAQLSPVLTRSVAPGCIMILWMLVISYPTDPSDCRTGTEASSDRFVKKTGSASLDAATVGAFRACM